MLPGYDIYAWTTKKATGTCARYTQRREKGSTFADSRVLAYLAIERIHLLLADTKSDLRVYPRTFVKEARLRSHGRTNEKRIALLTRASFHSNARTPRRAPRRVNAQPANIFAGIHKINCEQPRILTFSVDKKRSSRK